MQRHIITALLLSSLGVSGDSSSIEFSGVMAQHHYSKKETQHILIKRNIPTQCQKEEMISNEMVWMGQYANDKVPQECKSTFVHTTGHLQPMKLHSNLETYGELETLEFIKQMQTRDDMLLIDSRKEKWYSQSPKMIHALIEVGYPPQKIKWYRGGMQSWLGAGLTSTRK